MRNPAKTVITVSLLPAEWGESDLQACFEKLLEAARSIPALAIKSEEDFIVLFPKDAMEKGLGTEIVVKVDVPAPYAPDWETENKIAYTFFFFMQDLFPTAHVQCMVKPFEMSHGFWATGL